MNFAQYDGAGALVIQIFSGEGLFQAAYRVEYLRGIPVAVTYGTQMNSPIRPNNIGRWQALNLPLFEGIRINIHKDRKANRSVLEKPFNLSRCITKINPDQQDIFFSKRLPRGL